MSHFAEINSDNIPPEIYNIQGEIPKVSGTTFKRFIKHAGDGIWKQHKIVTWYAFRKVSRGATKKEMKWSFIPITNINQMVLSFEDGLTLKEFVKSII